MKYKNFNLMVACVFPTAAGLPFTVKRIKSKAS